MASKRKPRVPPRCPGSFGPRVQATVGYLTGRLGVIGIQNEDGKRFVERVLAAATALRQRHREVYLTEACAAAMRGDKAPSPLPEASIIQSDV